MKIALATIGSRGDIQPYIALADELKKAGHKPFIVTHSWAKKLIESYGIEHVSVGEGVNVEKSTQDIIEKSKNLKGGFFAALNFIFDTLRVCHGDFMKVFADVDLIIGHGVTGISEAEMLGKPYVISSLEPMGLPTLKSKTGNPIIDFYKNLPGKFLNFFFGKPYVKFRKDIGALPYDFEKPGKHPHLAILPVSSVIMKARENWKPVTEIVGYYFIDTPESFVPSPELEIFINEGEKPILISFGSMIHKPEELPVIFKLITEAVNFAGVRAILLMADMEPDQVELPENIFLIKSVPYPYILKHVSLVIHHFGFGTTAEVLKAGLPSIPIPHIFDQNLRAKQLYKKGLTQKPLSLKKLTPQKLGLAIQAALQDDILQKNVSEAAKTINEEEGLKKTVSLIELYFSGKN